MAKCAALLDDAFRNPAGLRFRDVVVLAECWGFVLRRTTGSHRIYMRPDFRHQLNFQPDQNGMAKRFQVKQLLEAIERLQEEGVTSR